MIQRSTTFLVIVSVASTTLAGCVGSSRGSGSDGLKVLDGDETTAGLVNGVVTDPELLPIGGARVTLLELSRSTNTSDDGSFGFPNVPPGPYQLFIDALGYESIGRRIDVVVGDNPALRFILEPLAILEPYTEMIPKRGYTLCDVNAVYLSLTLALPGCEAKATVFHIPVQETWSYAIVEMRWQAQEAMNLVSDNDNDDCLLDNSDPCFIWKIGRSPMRFDARPLDQNFSRAPDYLYPQDAFNWVILGYSAGMFQEEIQGSGTCIRQGEPPCNGVGVSVGTTFDLYISIFHHEEPSDKEAYSAIPDG